MFDVQKYEQPPADIIKDLAPGLKFDENGKLSEFNEKTFICMLF